MCSVEETWNEERHACYCGDCHAATEEDNYYTAETLLKSTEGRAAGTDSGNSKPSNTTKQRVTFVPELLWCYTDR